MRRARLRITFLADPLFHGYLSSGAQKFVQRETACGGAQKNSPIPSFMATFHQWTNLCQTKRAIVAGTPCPWPCHCERSKNNSPIRYFMANLPTRCSRQRQERETLQHTRRSDARNSSGAETLEPDLRPRPGHVRWAFNSERACPVSSSPAHTEIVSSNQASAKQSLFCVNHFRNPSNPNLCASAEIRQGSSKDFSYISRWT
jgi:hypothetical protein